MSDLERARQVAERAVKHVTWTAATAGPNGQSRSVGPNRSNASANATAVWGFRFY